MAYLLDTHVLLWWDAAPDRLGKTVRPILEDGQSSVFVSVATIWEIAIKRSTGRLVVTGSPAAVVLGLGFDILPILSEDAEAAGALPPIHKDPFDRMLIAQAQRRGLVLITADLLLPTYDVDVLRAGRGSL